MNNPFLKEFNTPFQSIPFQDIKLEHYKPAMEHAIQEGKADIEKIKNSEANFSNTIEAFERAGKLVGTISGVFFNLNSAHTSDEMQALAQELSPMLTVYSNEIMLDSKLFEKIKQVYNEADFDSLTQEQGYLLKKIYRSFVRNGANLDEASKEELKSISTELSKLKLKYSENVLKDTNQFELWIENEEDLAGLPAGVREAAAMLAKSKGKENAWLVNLDYPSYIPFMKYSEKRELRKQLFIAFASRSFHDNEYNNEVTLKKIAELRLKKANLLGYDTHATFTLEERMAEKPEKVYQLWDELLEFALPKAKQEIEEVQQMSNQLGGPTPIEKWDFSYYSEKLKNEKFAINDEILKPYFQLEKVVDGAFKTAEKLYGLKFEERNDIQKYHEDVTTYEVKDRDGNHLALFYTDFFPRETKRSGAWMTSYRDQNAYDGTQQRPLVSIVCNFTKPTASKPSLLTFNEVTTLFHEFGHALHGICANGYFESLSGTSVYWDFVELPSQLMENWCYEQECLNLFAKHYETNELIPMKLVQKIKDSVNFLSAYQTVRQVGLGKLDMSWHNLTEMTNDSVYDFEQKSNADTALFPKLEGTNTSCAFSHIFSGGYSAGYYSYKWAEVLEADAFEYFQENGVFNQEVASKFHDHVLSKGGSDHPMTLYKAFRGTEPSSKALLRKSGLIPKEAVN